MHFSIILLHLAGATMLLLYAVHMVRTGMERAYGTALRRLLGGAKSGPVKAAGGGVALAIMLQSSTAVAMLACGFAASGVLALPVGLSLLLGADLGSALVVRVLSFDLGWMVPVCLFAGGVMFLKLPGQRVREAGRMVLGIGFVLLSLNLIGEATHPLRESTMLPAFSAYLADDYVTAFIIGAMFTWLVHSSVASVLMVAAFVSQGLLPLEAGVPLVLGANLGGGLIAFWLSRGMQPAAQRIPVGNLLFRAVGAVFALMAVEAAGLPVELLGGNHGAALVNLHVVFNACLLVVCLPFAGLMARLTQALLPDLPGATGAESQLGNRTSALDRAVIDRPRLALASATRELLRMGELVEIMVRPVMKLFASGTREEIARLRGVDTEVNRAHTEIKLYLAEVNRGHMTGEEARKSIELTDFAINLEHAGDIVAKTLLVLADERLRRNLRFSGEGWAELTELHDRLVENMHLALNVLVSNDLPAARQLVVEKERMRVLERRSHDRHLSRLRTGTPESVETSDMHLEVARALKEINSLLVTVAYPLLTESGDLLHSRLTQTT
ncbi:Na/Pi cotransporter family protein [Nitratireductor sp. CAU 1489]|uniref:Na/Pi cotransporter family protein n=1 Tax=Nitratireductor arenosus TaxID=2682096 RepID=A0A844QFE7_9HYPH|nr:Na/Pi cotransporter family protein [Nitratireductor arenosus]MVA98082.1 Na/Pi cotransporter family protein [Nitratireductor arenosus]